MNALTTSKPSDVDVEVPVLETPTAAELIGMLRAQLDRMGLDRIRRNDHGMAIRRLEAYLATRPAGTVAVDEALLNAFEDWLVDGTESRRTYHRKMSSHVRSIVNRLPDGMKGRRLLTNTETKRLDRFAEFTPTTKELLDRFLADGRKVKRTPDGLKSTSVLLSRSVREGAVYAATMLMRLVGVSDVREVTRKHVDQYLRHRGEESRGSAIHILWNMRSLFRHLAAAGTISEDPLDGLGQQKTSVDGDYVPADQIAKLADLATLDAGNFEDVRGRLLAFALCYDYGLRVGEAARLRVSDVRVGDFVEVAVRGEIQKGADKPTVTLRNLFPESKRLFQLYLAVRQAGGSDALLLSEAGAPLLISGCRNAVKRVSRELGIKTHGGRTPPPHRYRHSLGTLNVGELGMRLSPYYLMRRYRHNDLRITTEVYVTHNPLLDEAQHVAIVNAANGNGHAAGAIALPQAMAPDIRIPELDAMARVRSLGINWRSMREHAIGERAAVERSGKVFYSESFLDGLCGEWMTKKEAMRLMGITSATAYLNRVRNHGIGTLVIGHTSLARSTDVVRSLRRQGE
jgi:integrase